MFSQKQTTSYKQKCCQYLSKIAQTHLTYTKICEYIAVSAASVMPFTAMTALTRYLFQSCPNINYLVYITMVCSVIIALYSYKHRNDDWYDNRVKRLFVEMFILCCCGCLVIFCIKAVSVWSVVLELAKLKINKVMM